MASSVEHQMAAALERAAPVATAPGGGGAGPLDPQWRKTAAAALRGRMAAQRERGAGTAALASARSLALQAFSRQGNREQLKGLKEQLRDLQSQLTKTLSVQSCKESKGKLTTESISDATAMIERLGNSVADLRDKRDKRTTVISEQLQALEPLEANTNEDAAVREKMEEAVFWYEKFLGFKIVGEEEGVKFIFNKVDPQSPEKEYSLCINFDKDRYNSVLECDPHIKDVEKLVKDLNLSDDVVKFVRIIREKFQSSAMNGTLPISPVADPDVSAAPFPSPTVTSVDGRMDEFMSRVLVNGVCIWSSARQSRAQAQAQQQNGGGGAHALSSKLARYLDPEASWDKDQLLDAVHWIRQAVGLFCGLLWGAVPLVGAIWIALFMAISTGIIYWYYAYVLKIDEEEYGGHGALLQEGLFASFTLFLLSWTLVYSLAHF
ncbi:kinetochore protein Spc25-like isoform X1 [Panicum miliaceum]|uniref:Kinetochore protein SPC25 n=1 Tax=Panicum miliaceum TaxID=4540 RepID=A0A3L6T4N3_PANMI|nr:kinetochore protein Spc25-like isoform X1 [Panicum miliaceum]